MRYIVMFASTPVRVVRYWVCRVFKTKTYLPNIRILSRNKYFDQNTNCHFGTAKTVRDKRATRRACTDLWVHVIWTNRVDIQTNCKHRDVPLCPTQNVHSNTDLATNIVQKLKHRWTVIRMNFYGYDNECGRVMTRMRKGTISTVYPIRIVIFVNVDRLYGWENDL